MNDVSHETLAEAVLVYVRALLEADLAGRPAPTLAPDAPVPGGLFVTIYDADGELRGSRGTSLGGATASALATQMARAAAFDDPRFPPVSAGELDRCRLAVTLLGPGTRIRGPEGIELGITALRISSGVFSGTTLPEVAWGRGWDAPTFLAYACRKAGLHALAWKAESTEVLAFPSTRAAESA